MIPSRTHMLVVNTISSCGEDNPIAGLQAMEDIIRTGENPLLEEFLALCTTNPERVRRT